MDELGRLRMKYEQDGNVVEVYNSPKVCSLVVNGKVMDEYRGMVAGRFVLRGQIEHNGEFIPVSAEMGYLYMRLYYAHQCVGKKFMGLG